MEYIFVGYKYYLATLRMGLLYQVIGNTLQRADWGMIETVLCAGQSITIRPATQEELDVLDNQLRTYKRRM